MRICCVDVETTSLDVEDSFVIELGYAIYDPDREVPIHIMNTLVTPKGPISEEIVQLTGIRQCLLDQFGRSPHEVFSRFLSDLVEYDVKYLVGHNIRKYDDPVIRHNMFRCGVGFTNMNLQLIDTMTDLPFEYEPASRKLVHLCTDHQFLNYYAHRALFDALACGKLLYTYDFEKVLALAQSPEVTIRAIVSFDDRAKASKRGYRWEADKRMWTKVVKKCHLEREVKGADFTVVVM
jgi:DNA polymerase-3 subunit epsilon